MVVLAGATRAATQRFTESNIFHIGPEPLSYTLSTPIPLETFDKPFRYLGCGTQFFALLSEDGSTVIKLFRKDRTTHPLKWCLHIAPLFIKKKMESTLTKRYERFEKTLRSCTIAHQYLKNQTGLIGIDLTPQPHEAPTLTYTDAIGVLHHLKLDGHPYLIQKCAAPFYPTLKEWIAKGDLEQAKDSLKELITLIENRCKQGIADKDPNMGTNFGWLNSHPVQTDVGRFSFDPRRSNPEIYKLELIRHTDRLCTWLDSHSPQLADWMRKEVRDR